MLLDKSTGQLRLSATDLANFLGCRHRTALSMATSTPEDAPRGMEFPYSLNRFNVATSRAMCAAIVVASPRLFEPECKSPRQMQLANALCRYREMARRIMLT